MRTLPCFVSSVALVFFSLSHAERPLPVTGEFWAETDVNPYPNKDPYGLHTLDSLKMLRREGKWAETFAVNNEKFKSYVEAMRRAGEAVSVSEKGDPVKFYKGAVTVEGPIIVEGNRLFVRVSANRAYLPQGVSEAEVIKKAAAKMKNLNFEGLAVPGSTIELQAGSPEGVPVSPFAEKELTLFTAYFDQDPNVKSSFKDVDWAALERVIEKFIEESILNKRKNYRKKPKRSNLKEQGTTHGGTNGTTGEESDYPP